jgi:CubicO group peptidase (beta-lactamase class C family)
MNAQVEAAINSILKDSNTPGGVGVAVAQKTPESDWRVETKGYGLAKVDGTRVTEDTLFGIGSNSKAGICCTGRSVSFVNHAGSFLMCLPPDF